LARIAFRKKPLRTRPEDGALRCHTCGAIRPAADFAFSNIALGRLSYACRSCHAAARRAHYLAHKADYLRQAVAQRKAHRARNRNEVMAYLAQHPCVDCREANPVVLEFDHRDPATKLDEVGRMIASKRWPRVLAEIKKCDVRCINCHRRKTAREFGWAKTSEPVQLGSMRE
jgi:hypothetical protein